MMNFIAKLCW